MCRRREKGGGRWFHGGACARVILKGTEHTHTHARVAFYFLIYFFCIKQKIYIYIFDSDALQSVILESSGLVGPLREIFFTRGPKCQSA